MEKNKLLEIYDKTYAENYNQHYLTNPYAKINVDFELEILKGLVKEDTKWLDVACGTGYFLSQFKGHQRAGIDLSPNMLEYAKKENEDALFFKQWDFRNQNEEWNNKWSLISSMWYPYSYVDTMDEIEAMLRNLVNWLQPGGNLYLPIADIEDLRSEVSPIKYKDRENVYNGSISITGYIWSWQEDNSDKTHTHLIAPHAEHFIQFLEPFFETIELIRYPPMAEGWVSRRAIVAKGKVDTGSVHTHKAKTIRQGLPDLNNFNSIPSEHLKRASHKQLIKELTNRIFNGSLFKRMLSKILNTKK